MAISLTPTYPAPVALDAAEQTITFAAGAPTRNWTVTLSIAGKSVPFIWRRGDTNAIGATRCAKAINDALGAIVTATASSAEVTVTFKVANRWGLIRAEQTGGETGIVVAGRQVALTSSVATGEHVVWRLDSVPPESDLTTGLLIKPFRKGERPTSGAQIVERGLVLDRFEPDVAGEYVLSALSYNIMPGIGAGSLSERRVVFVNAETEATVHVGHWSSLPVETLEGHNATLRFLVVNETIREAEYINPTTELARVAITQTAVTDALAACVGVAVSAVGNSPETDLNNLLTEFDDHRQLTAGGVHLAVDNENEVLSTRVDSRHGAIAVFNEAREKILSHVQKARAGGSPWHNENDWKSTPQTGSASSLAQLTVSLADLRERVFERHRVQASSPDVHGNDPNGDTTNALSAPTKLDDVLVAYLDAVASTAPTAPTGESEGAVDLRHLWGFS